MKWLIRMSAMIFAFALPAAVATAQEPQTKVATPGNYDGGYLVFQSADSAFAYWLDGRVQADAALYRGGDNKLGSGTDIRRARIGAKVTLYRDWHGEFDVDFADNAVEMKDMWIGYLGFRNTMLKAGNFKEPFSLETITSSKFITFMERSYIDNFSPDRHIGASAVRWGNMFYATAGVFGQEAGTPDETGRGEAVAVTGRLVISPVHRDGAVLHFGGAFSRRGTDAAAGADTNTVRFRARPETNISRARFLTTGKVRFVDHTNYYNGEFAASYGPATLQSEYTRVALVRLGDRPQATFDGMYVSASVFLTGEHRPYLMQEGEWDRVFPRQKSGAWEVAARWSTMDLNDTSEGVNIKGGRGTNVTLGLNWHMNANFKWMFNYVRVSNDANAKPDIGIAPLTAGDKFNIFQTRFSLAF
jgi:phosphate-selective porin OprO/OprP